MSKTLSKFAAARFVVTSKPLGDHSAFVDPKTASEVAFRLNTHLFDAMVYFPLIAEEFVISFADEARLNQAYNDAEFFVDTIPETEV